MYVGGFTFSTRSYLKLQYLFIQVDDVNNDVLSRLTMFPFVALISCFNRSDDASASSTIQHWHVHSCDTCFLQWTIFYMHSFNWIEQPWCCSTFSACYTYAFQQNWYSDAQSLYFSFFILIVITAMVSLSPFSSTDDVSVHVFKSLLSTACVCLYFCCETSARSWDGSLLYQLLCKVTVIQFLFFDKIRCRWIYFSSISPCSKTP